MSKRGLKMPDGGTPVMRIRVWSILIVALVVLVGASRAGAQTPPPAIFFTDLQSGPNSGGDSQSGYSGVYVTLYGNFFGATQGSSTVTLNGSSCLRVVSWGTPWLWYQKIVVQVGPNCVSGNVVVTTSAGASNPAAFTVRPGNIYCISTTGSDSNSGKFPSSCWATITSAAGRMIAGDTVYLENGVVNTTVASYSAVVSITKAGTATNPIAFVGYPGATATIGDINNSPYAIRVPQIGANPAYIVVANLTLRGQEAMDPFGSDHWYVIGNDMSCTAAGISCFHSNQSTNLFIYGNNVHNIIGNVKLYHAVYFTTNTNHVWVGWNLVDPDPNHTGAAGCRGIQFYSTGGSNQFDLHVHDNTVRNTICDGIAMTTVDASLGTVEVYDNAVYHSGTGPDPQGQLSHYTCIQLSGNAAVSAPALVYNNSLYDCGARAWSGISGGFELNVPAKLNNNVAYMTSGEPYVDSAGSCGNGSGSNNDWFGNGAPPCSSNITGSLNVDPGFTNTKTGSVNLQLQASSQIIDVGMTLGTLTYDITGVARPQGSGYDIGAYEFFAGGTTVQKPNPPTNLTVIVK